MPLVDASPDWVYASIVAFDEERPASMVAGTVATAAAGRMAASRGCRHDSIIILSVLRTIEEVYGLPFLGSAATATTMTELLPPSPTPTRLRPNSYRYSYRDRHRYNCSNFNTHAQHLLQRRRPHTPSCDLIEGFENITTLVPSGWVRLNRSQPVGTTEWLQGNSSFGWLGGYGVRGLQSGSPASFMAANF